MRSHNSQVSQPPQSLLKRPTLRGEEQDFYTGSGGQENATIRGKRGAMNQEPAAGSPRAVRARIREQSAQQQQQQPANHAPFAVSRRCSYVERRPAAVPNSQMHFARTGVDSWEPSCIEPGAFASVGSAIEDFRGPRMGHGYGHAMQADVDREALHAPRGHHKDAASQHMRMAVEDANYAHRPAAGQMRSMATQTNRESMMRHHMQNGGSPARSDDEDESRMLQENRNMLNSHRSGMTGKSGFTEYDNMSMLNTARSTLREMQYPAKSRFQMSAATEEVMRKVAPKAASSPSAGKLALGQALACAMNDEFVDLDRYWGIGGSGDTKVEERVASCLKKFAKRAEKACMQKALTAKAPGKPLESSVQEEPAMAVGDRCSHVESQIAAADQRIACLKEALQRPVQAQEPSKFQVLRDLSDRLSALQDASEDVPLPGLAAIANNVEQSIQGLVAANAASRQLYQQCQDEHESVQERNREFCPPASSTQQAPGVDAGARSILRGLR